MQAGGGGGEETIMQRIVAHQEQTVLEQDKDKIHKYIFRVQKIVQASTFLSVILLSFRQRATKRPSGLERFD
jgi:hypothetical protein